eukprot:6106170-Pleurochrysis_carterae.AAC.1
MLSSVVNKSTLYISVQVARKLLAFKVLGARSHMHTHTHARTHTPAHSQACARPYAFAHNCPTSQNAHASIRLRGASARLFASVQVRPLRCRLPRGATLDGAAERQTSSEEA